MSETPQDEEELMLTDADRVYVGQGAHTHMCVCVWVGVGGTCKKVVFNQQLSLTREKN